MITRERIDDYLSTHEPDMRQMLGRMVEIQSSSHNKAGVDQVARFVHDAVKDLPVQSTFESQSRQGDHLIIRTRAVGERSAFLLVGHMDTVFPADTRFNWYKEDDQKCYGPGVVDMKGGLVVGLYAMKALHAAECLDRIPITFLLNSDEEIGSPSSAELIQQEARRSQMAMVLECGGLNGEVVVGRKGNMTFKLEVQGRAGHAAFAGPAKASAILELAHQCIAMERLNDHQKGITVNMGKISGGIGPNTIPEQAQAAIDCRFLTLPDRETLKKQLEEIAAGASVPGTRCRLALTGGRGPMEASQRNLDLFEKVETVARELGISIKPEVRKGVSDANLIAHVGVPVLDGLGPIGARDHSKDEYMLKTSLHERCRLLAMAIAHLAPQTPS